MAASSGVATIAVSGATCTGKTSTMALLKELLPPSTIFIHADAFGRTLEEMPIHDGYSDCDSRHSYRYDDLTAAIDYATSSHQRPPGSHSFEALERDLETYKERLEPRFVNAMRSEMSSITWVDYSIVVVVDCLLLFHEAALRRRFNLMLLLRASRSEVWRRRSLRYSVMQIQGQFWQTKGYLDSCVWRHYVNEHIFLFPNGDVTGKVTPWRQPELDQHTARRRPE